MIVLAGHELPRLRNEQKPEQWHRLNVVVGAVQRHAASSSSSPAGQVSRHSTIGRLFRNDRSTTMVDATVVYALIETGGSNVVDSGASRRRPRRKARSGTRRRSTPCSGGDDRDPRRRGSRYEVRFPDADALRANQAVESPLLDVAVINNRRASIDGAYRSMRISNVLRPLIAPKQNHELHQAANDNARATSRTPTLPAP